MSADPSMSIQAQIRPGREVDLYYMNEMTAMKQAFPVCMNTRFTQDLTNKTSGSSTFIIPPSNGINQVVCVLGWNAGTWTTAGALGCALPRGWGYSAIKQVSVRYGGSSQYFFTGAQLLQRSLRQCPNGTARDALLALGGNATLTQADLVSNNQLAYVFLNLPHTATTSDGVTTTVLPSDLLNQQIVVTVELNPVNSWISNTGGGNGVIPTAFDVGYFQVQQSMLDDQQDSLARRVDMNTHFYALPLPSFDQQQLVIPASVNNSSVQPYVLTGFRNGSLRSIQLWLTNNVDNPSGSTGVRNPFAWYIPDSVQLIYAGTIYANYQNGSSALWNLLNGRQQPAANNVYQTVSTNTYSAANSLTAWVDLPFAQPHVQESTTNVLVHGIEVRNGIINLQLALPNAVTSQAAYSAASWSLNVVYVYNAALMFSKSTCDYVF